MLSLIHIFNSAFFSFQITASELTFVYHTVKHHLSYASTDCNVKISFQLFPDSTIANKITCGKTKCEALVTGVLGPNSVNNLTQKLKDNKFFGVGFDASKQRKSKVLSYLCKVL